MRLQENVQAKALDWDYYAAKAETMSDAELHYAALDAWKAAQAQHGTETEGLYMDEISVYRTEQRKRRG